MKTIFIILFAFILTGCFAAHYKYSDCKAVDVCTTLEIKTNRQLEEGVVIEYEGLTIKTGKVTSSNPLEEIGKTAVEKFMDRDF